jgi:hypothetical protein
MRIILFLASNSCRGKGEWAHVVTVEKPMPPNSKPQAIFTTHFPADSVICRCSNVDFSLSLWNKFMSKERVCMLFTFEHTCLFWVQRWWTLSVRQMLLCYSLIPCRKWLSRLYSIYIQQHKLVLTAVVSSHSQSKKNFIAPHNEDPSIQMTVKRTATTFFFVILKNWKKYLTVYQSQPLDIILSQPLTDCKVSVIVTGFVDVTSFRKIL